MKPIILNPFRPRLLLLWICAVGIFVPAMGQDKIVPRLDVSYYVKDDAIHSLHVLVRQRIDKRFEPISAAEVNCFLELPDGTAEVGSVTTNVKGEGQIFIHEHLVTAMNDLDEYTFTAEIVERDSMEGASEMVAIKASRLRVETDDADKSIRISLQAKTDGVWEPFADAELGVFIKRQFGRIPAGEETYTTDENGQVELTFDTEIPGDVHGFITLECVVEDNDELGNLATATQVKWGIPLEVTDNFNKRSLWGTRDKTPWWLLVFPNAIIAGVWGVVVYLVVTLFRIKRLGRSSDTLPG